MDRRSVVTVGLAVAGFIAIGVGIHQELLHAQPAAEATVVTGWGRGLNHEERLLALLGAVGVGGAVGTIRSRWVAAVPAVVGGVVLFSLLRAVLHYGRDPGLYTEVPVYGGWSVRYVLGAEPFLLAAGGVLLSAAGIVGWRSNGAHTDIPVAG